MKCQIIDLGLISYDRAYTIQKEHVQAVMKGGMPALLICEHLPVLTLGRLAKEQHILFSKGAIEARGVEIHPIDRGGDITLHAPGQLVIYPILNLNNYGKDLRSYLRQLEQVAIDLLGGFDIVASRFPGQTGVWLGSKKIASIGIGVRKWISYHGMALNVSTDLSLFSLIKPCGLDVEMTSMSDLRNYPVKMDDVKNKMIEHFCKNFQLTI